MRYRIGAHRGSEDEQDRTEDRRSDHRQRHAQHDLPLRGIEDGRCFLEVRIHVFKDTTDQDVGERCIVKTEYHGTRESAQAEPLRHTDAEQRCEEAIGRTADSIGIKHMLPYDGESPLWHDVRKNENRA